MSNCSSLLSATKRMVALGCCFGNRFRIAVIVLLGLHVRPHILRRHQPNCVSLGGKNSSEMMSTTASFHRNHARRKLCSHSHDGFALHPAPQNDFARAVKPDHAAAVLPRSMPRTAISIESPFLSPNRPPLAQQEGRAGRAKRARSFAWRLLNQNQRPHQRRGSADRHCHYARAGTRCHRVSLGSVDKFDPVTGGCEI